MYRTKLRLNLNCKDFDEDLLNEGYQVSRSPIRLRYNKQGKNPKMEWYSDLNHGCTDWKTADTIIEGFIRKNVGRKFDDVFHEFITKTKFYRELKCYGYHTPKSIFLSYFKKVRMYKPSYYVDDEGIIRETPGKLRRPNNIVIYDNDPISKYTLNTINFTSLRNVFIPLFGNNLYNEILHKKIFTDNDIDKLWNRMLKQYSKEEINIAFSNVRRFRNFHSYICYSYFNNRITDKWKQFFFNKEKKEIRKVLYYGTKEYYKHLKEEKKRRAAEIRERKHPDRSSYDAMLKTRKLMKNGKNSLEKIM